MSRVGRKAVALPKGVKASVAAGAVAHVNIEGPKGKLSLVVPAGLNVKSDSESLQVALDGGDAPNARMKAVFGSTRAHLNNMVLGVSTGWKRSLEMNGVGFGAKLAGSALTLSVGFSHDVVLQVPQGIKCAVTKNVIDLEGADVRVLGQFAAEIRRVQPPEPYLGKGIKYAEEKIRRKAGKTGKK
jgi:large subunit ribosomal protein L6